jgi:hypothetical protein
MMVVCAWCGKVLGGEGRITHTCCRGCQEIFFPKTGGTDYGRARIGEDCLRETGEK